MASLRKRGRVWYYRYVDADGVQHERKGCADRRETEAMAASLESEASKVKARLIDPKEVRFRDHEDRPLGEHLADWRRDMAARRKTAKHADLYRDRAGKLAAVVRGVRLIDLEPGLTRKDVERGALALAAATASARLSDLTSVGVQAALARLIDAGKSHQTVNHYRAALRAFVRWARDNGRMRDNPMRGVKGFNVEEDLRHERRSLTDHELALLIRTAETGPIHYDMTGPLRAMAYRLATATGFRADEMRSLTPESFRLTGPEPTVFLRASATKNRRPVEQPIPLALAATLATWLRGKPAGASVLPLHPETAKVIRADLADAGIPYATDEGIADFHSLRAYFVSALVRAGVSIKGVQTLARHAKPETTLNHYAKVSMHDLRGAVESLPSPHTDLGPETMAATGTHGRIEMQRALPLPYAGDGSGQFGAETGGSAPTTLTIADTRETLENKGIERVSRGSESVRPAGVEPATYGLGNRRSIHLSYGRSLLSRV